MMGWKRNSNRHFDVNRLGQKQELKTVIFLGQQFIVAARDGNKHNRRHNLLGAEGTELQGVLIKGGHAKRYAAIGMTTVRNLYLFANILSVLGIMYSFTRVVLGIEHALDMLTRCYYFNYPPYTWCGNTVVLRPLPSDALVWSAVAMGIIFCMVTLNQAIDNWI